MALSNERLLARINELNTHKEAVQESKTENGQLAKLIAIYENQTGVTFQNDTWDNKD